MVSEKPRASQDTTEYDLILEVIEQGVRVPYGGGGFQIPHDTYVKLLKYINSHGVKIFDT